MGDEANTVEATGLDDHALLERIAAAEAEIARLQARQLADLAEFARRPAHVHLATDGPVDGPVVDLAVESAGWAALGQYARDTADHECAMRLTISRRSADQRLWLACAMQRLPSTRAALHAGRIDLTRARVIAVEVADLDPVTAREVEARVIEPAGRLSAPRLRERVRRAVLAADPVAADVRHTRERRERRVCVEQAPDGMAWVHAFLTAPEARTVHSALTAAARSAKVAGPDSSVGGRARPRGPKATTDELRADALVAMCVDALRSGEAAGFGPLARHLGEVTTVQVTVAASTLLGFDDAAAVLDGYGPITAEQARALAPDARWRRVLTDPASGAVLDVGTTTYRPPTAIARHVEARDQRCMAPGCGVPAARCELDHTVRFPEGPTSAANLHPLCTAHHQLKHSGVVEVENRPDGCTRWTMPTGHAFETRPPPVGGVWGVADDHAPDFVQPWWSDAWADA